MANAPDNFDGDRRTFDVERRDTVVIFVGFGVEIDGAGGFLSPRRRGRNHRQIDDKITVKITVKNTTKYGQKRRKKREFDGKRLFSESKLRHAGHGLSPKIPSTLDSQPSLSQNLRVSVSRVSTEGMTNPGHKTNPHFLLNWNDGIRSVSQF